MKKIRVPLTDINGVDIMTGKKVEGDQMSFSLQEKMQEAKAKFQQKVERESVNGKVFVLGLGYVSVA